MDISEIHQVFLNSKGICTDTRQLKNQQLFVALKGANFDGNKYALNALENGASYAIIDDKTISNSRTILVEDALKTLQELAKFHRNYLNIPIIGLTGSNGKTTTKELIHAVLNTQYNCVATKGNLNNHIGVPLTLLTMDENTEIGVVEMGANHLKEIAELSEIAKPNYGYITNIGKAHLEGFGSEENILIGKTELYDYIKKTNGKLFCNADDKKLYPLAKLTSSVMFTKKTNSYFKVEISKTNPFLSVIYDGFEANTNLIGNYNYSNIAASITIGKHFNVKNENIKKAIENYTPTNNRSELINKGNNIIILDAYNANPSSMKVALEHFNKAKTNKNKVAILGDMFELGKYALKEHQAITDLVADSSLCSVFLVGNHFSECAINSTKISLFKDTKSLILHLKESPITNSFCLVKGSRGMKLEETLSAFE